MLFIFLQGIIRMASSTQIAKLAPELWGNVASFLPVHDGYHLLQAGSIAHHQELEGRMHPSCFLSRVASVTHPDLRIAMCHYYNNSAEKSIAERILSRDVVRCFNIDDSNLESIPIGLAPGYLNKIDQICKSKFEGWQPCQLFRLLQAAVAQNLSQVVIGLTNAEHFKEISDADINRVFQVACNYAFLECVEVFLNHPRANSLRPSNVKQLFIRATAGGYSKIVAFLISSNHHELAQTFNSQLDAVDQECLSGVLESAYDKGHLECLQLIMGCQYANTLNSFRVISVLRKAYKDKCIDQFQLGSFNQLFFGTAIAHSAFLGDSEFLQFLLLRYNQWTNACSFYLERAMMNAIAKNHATCLQHIIKYRGSSIQPRFFKRVLQELVERNAKQCLDVFLQCPYIRQIDTDSLKQINKKAEGACKNTLTMFLENSSIA